jgi:hypothetical protein
MMAITTIAISKEKSIEHIQKSFNQSFPFLKIEFFTQPHEKGKPTSAKHLVNPKKLFGDFNPMQLSGELNVSESMTVFELEAMFEHNYGLHVQVFRKSGRIWLETTATDDWTLASQNEQGRELSEGTPEKGEAPDYHEQE